MLDVISGKRKPYDADAEYISPDNTNPLDEETTELEERSIDISHYVVCLYKFSISIRSAAPRDKRQKWMAIEISHYHAYDIGHVREKFPDASPQLHERLGKANSRRRQLLVYNEMHNSKISQLFPIKHNPVEAPVSDEIAENDAQSHIEHTDVIENQEPEVSSKAPTQTTVTTVKDFWSELPTHQEEPEEAMSTTSYASSVNENSGNLLSIPPPPDAEAFNGTPFICPFCYAQVIVTSDRSWK